MCKEILKRRLLLRYCLVQNKFSLRSVFEIGNADSDNEIFVDELILLNIHE